MPSIEPYIEPPQAPDQQGLPERFMRWLELLRGVLSRTPEQLEGDGSPEGAIKARRGTHYFNRTGSAGSWLYVKTTPTGNTGWVAYA